MTPTHEEIAALIDEILSATSLTDYTESRLLKLRDKLEQLAADLLAVCQREAAMIARYDAKLDAAEAEVARLRYVLEGVRGAIQTGRNEPLMIWRDQIEIALCTPRDTEQGDANP